MFTADDKALIEELGLGGLSEEYQAEGLQSFRDSLAIKVEMVLEDKLSDEQLAEFEKVSDKGDDSATMAWLRKVVPDYDKLVSEQTAALKHDIKHNANRFKAATDEVYE